MEIRESEVEDVLVNAPSLTASLLNLDDDPHLLIRQMPIPSGRIDLLYAHHTNLLLLELKVVAFQKKFLEQILNYKNDLTDLQESGKLIKGNISPFLLCTIISKFQKEESIRLGVRCIDYDPAYVLQGTIGGQSIIFIILGS